MPNLLFGLSRNANGMDPAAKRSLIFRSISCQLGTDFDGLILILLFSFTYRSARDELGRKRIFSEFFTDWNGVKEERGIISPYLFT